MVEIVPPTSNSSLEISGIRDVSCGEVPRRNLGVDLDLGIWGEQLVRDGDSFQDLKKKKKEMRRKVRGQPQSQITLQSRNTL